MAHSAAFQYVIKVIISAVLIVAAAEIGKRSAIFGAILISIPLSSVLALSFLYVDTGDVQKVTDLARSILLLILPSLAFFVFLIALLKLRQPYWVSLLASSLGMAGVFFVYVRLLQFFGISE